MIKLTVVGDLHAKPSNLDKVEVLFNIVEELGNPTVWLGDMLDTKELVRGLALNLVYRKFKASMLTHFVLVGNHDWFNAECKDHSLQLLKELPNVRVIDQFTRMTLEGVDTAFMPYYSDLTQAKEALSTVGDAGLVFMHQGIDGFDYGNGRIASGEVSQDSVPKGPRVISGHFHKYQVGERLTYLGTPFSHDFGESNQQKYIAVLEQGRDGGHRSIELLPTPFLRHVTVTVDASLDDPNLDQLRDELAPDDQVRFILTGPQDAIDHFPREAFPGAKFIERPTTEASGTEISETLANEEKFVQWAVQVAQLDEAAVKAGLAILEAVR